MSAIDVAGGVYHERSTWPTWDQVFGSGGRAAACLVPHVSAVTLHSYARIDTATLFQTYAERYGFKFHPISAEQTVSFEYVHCLSRPLITPSKLRTNQPFAVRGDAVLRFGMLDGSAVVDAERCVYDPQSRSSPEPFKANGSRAAHLAVVANRLELSIIGGSPDTMTSAQSVLSDGADVVVAKCGAEGALVVEKNRVTKVAPYQSDRVWTIGSGDVFSAIFAARWGVHGDAPEVAADLASRAVAVYAGSMALPTPPVGQLQSSSFSPAVLSAARVYLAGPFFSIGQRWLVDEARRCLIELGMKVFSPVHDVGAGPAETVAPADLAGLMECDVVFAILDGLDSGTLFEVGHACAKGKPVYGLAQAVADEDLKMLVGSGVKIFDDFVTALHHLAWRA